MIIIKKLTPQEVDQFQALIEVFEKVFEMENFHMPAEARLGRVLQLPGFMVFVAILENKVVGGLTVYTLEQYYSEKPQAYVYDLAVSFTHQRKGIGRRLMAAVVEHCKVAGYEEVFVQAEKEDQHALDFYRSTPITEEEKVRHFIYNLSKGSY